MLLLSRIKTIGASMSQGLKRKQLDQILSSMPDQIDEIRNKDFYREGIPYAMSFLAFANTLNKAEKLEQELGENRGLKKYAEQAVTAFEDSLFERVRNYDDIQRRINLLWNSSTDEHSLLSEILSEKEFGIFDRYNIQLTQENVTKEMKIRAKLEGIKNLFMTEDELQLFGHYSHYKINQMRVLNGTVAQFLELYSNELQNIRSLSITEDIEFHQKIIVNHLNTFNSYLEKALNINREELGKLAQDAKKDNEFYVDYYIERIETLNVIYKRLEGAGYSRKTIADETYKQTAGYAYDVIVSGLGAIESEVLT